MNKILVFIPTYNELENVGPMCEQIMDLPLSLDLLFMDDDSPDGTGEELDRLATLCPRIKVKHRSGKLGIGSAHQEGIAYAYQKGYELLITMDGDFTHEPQRIPDLLEAQGNYHIVLGSRYLQAGSLPGWNLFRKTLTKLGHFLTRNLLRIKYDATGAFRLYDLKTIPVELFSVVRSRSYSFFFESLFVLINNGLTIKEIPIILPSRTYGRSKLSLVEAFRSAIFLFELSIEKWMNPGKFRAGRQIDRLQENLNDPQNWAPYWRRKNEFSNFIYEQIATNYRNLVLRPILVKILLSTFTRQSHLLHAGCGSGQVDIDLQEQLKITAVDISRDALDLYSRYNPNVFRLEQADILDLPHERESYDGIYNLGVFEHFTTEEILKILNEFHRVLRPNGKLVIFWPHRYASSVLLLKIVRWIALTIGNKEMKFHPAEISLLKSKKQVQSLLEASQFDLVRYRMNMRGGFIQAIVIGRKHHNMASGQI